MKNPKLITKPFAQNGQKNAIPENFSSSMESNQATWDTGFGQITMIPVAAGGLPPKGQDFNGIFNQISENVVYLSMGGRFKFSADYAAAINGYPKGAILQSDDEKKEYQSIIDNNKVNFNTATQAQINAAWKLISTDDLLQQIANKQPSGNYALKGDSYTKDEANKKFQLIGSYADGNRFKTIPSNVSMSPPEGSISLVLQNDGTLFMWDGAKSIFRISNAGEITTGSMAYSRLTGVPIVQSTGGSTTSFMSQKAVTNMASGLQAKGDYADGKKFKVSLTNSSVLSPNGEISLVLQDDGTLFTWDGNKSVFSVSPAGKLLKGEIPYERLTGVPLNTLFSEDNGYWRCKDTGFMIQWGRASANGFVNFPIPFPKALFSFSGIHVGENAVPVRINAERSTLKGIDIAQSTTGQIGMRWIAIGF
ncbi:hypothetical protein AB7250_07850 [Providencia stuartii]|nr:MULTISPECIES: hypothetical protein [Providencia]MBQ0456076.1 hypothetical protein [Providencia stuartii]MDN7223998.1 hypothetical protein [Providencia stuartii]QIB29885.1 hypothetical protein G3A48_09135 [Providencia stuartii]QPN42198.1 hypothetical protein I3B46_08915 [Providencia sp. 2.29]WAZ77091.1 hypothetical protein O4001_12570 [Providencia stuartii]